MFPIQKKSFQEEHCYTTSLANDFIQIPMWFYEASSLDGPCGLIDNVAGTMCSDGTMCLDVTMCLDETMWLDETMCLDGTMCLTKPCSWMFSMDGWNDVVDGTM